jgi:hypothetical protein
MRSNGRQSVKPGDMLKIPYRESAVYGRIVYCDAKGTRISHRRGLYLMRRGIWQRRAPCGFDITCYACSFALH